MGKIAITILALLLLPMMVSAADELTLESGTQLDVGGITLIVSGLVDQMVVNTSDVTFTLSANSSLTVKSNDRKLLSNDLGLDISCSASYSQISISGNILGSSLVVTPSSDVCVDTTRGGGGGGGGAGAPVPTTPTTPTTSTGQVTATASAGGKTTLSTDENTTAAVELPAQAVSASTDIKITTEAKDTVTGSRATPSGRSVVGSYVYDFTATVAEETVSQFDKTITLTFSYTDEQISGLEESTLRVYYWKETTSQWVALPTTIDAAGNNLTATTNHFTYFAILGKAPGEEEEEIVEEEIIEEEEGAIQDGDVIRNPNAEGIAQFDIYIVKLVGSKKFKRLILSPHVFESYGHLSWEDVQDVDQATINEYTISDLVRAVGDEKVYKLSPTGDAGTKQWLNMSAAAFESADYDWDAIYVINITDRDAYSSGTAIIGEGAKSSIETIIIKVDKLRVRNLASLSGEILTHVYEGEVYDLLDEQNGWYKITANGVTGWCFGKDSEYVAKQ